MSASGISSTFPEEAQEQLEARARIDAANRARITQAKLRAQQRESRTEYGRRLFNGYAEACSLQLEHVLGQAFRGKVTAGPYYAGMLQLLGLGDKGPRAIMAVALSTTLDRLSERRTHRSVATSIGRALENELAAMPIEDRGADLLRIGRARYGKRLVEARNLRALRITPQAWTQADRFMAGAFLLEIIAAETGLFRIEEGATGRGRQLVPLPVVGEIIAAVPPTPMGVRRLPMLVPPRPWQGLTGGGHLDGEGLLVRSRQGGSLSYLEGRMAPALEVVNRLQEAQVLIDPWMVTQQRIAWDAGVAGLFPVQRQPIEVPQRPDRSAQLEVFLQWKGAAQRAHQDRIQGRPRRLRIETSLRDMELMAGRPVWFSWMLDHRGRCYTANTHATHQGPDAEKAAVLLNNAGPCDDRAATWILKAAAIHWGVKGSWVDRLAWGNANLDLMLAAAEEPIDRSHLWRAAADPWQFLSCCRAMQLWLQDPTQPIRQLIRLDQTTSGPGILAALTRDRSLALACNMIGRERGDLYVEVAELVTERLRSDLEAGDMKQQRLAAFWLERGVSRTLAKGPVVAASYGSRLLGLSEQLVAALDEEEGEVSLSVLERERLVPCRYLSRLFLSVLEARVKVARDLEHWLRLISGPLLTKDKPLLWTNPHGWPIACGTPNPSKSKINTLLHGSRRWSTVLDQPKPGELSARETNRGLAANLIHSFDAALVWSMVKEGAAHDVDLLPNHDCFAVPPCHADWLQQTLGEQVRDLYRTDWLQRITAETLPRTGRKTIEAPPNVGDLDPEEIGCNPYLFS